MAFPPLLKPRSMFYPHMAFSLNHHQKWPPLALKSLRMNSLPLRDFASPLIMVTIQPASLGSHRRQNLAYLA